MNIFIVSSFGDSLDLATKLQEEGNKVSLYVRSKYIKLPESDIVITNNPTADMVKSELTIIEDNKSGKFVDSAKKLNRPIIGGGLVVDRLTRDEKFGSEILVGCGLTLAREFTEGQLVEVGGWFTKGEFLKPYFLAFKYTKFGNNDVGPEVGPMGIVGTYKLKGKLFRETLLKIETFLKSIDYTGYIGLDVLINNVGIKIVGWQPGLSFPLVNILTCIHNNFGTFLFKIARGTAKVVSVQPDKVGIGVTWLKLPWLYETIVKNRPRMVCETGVNIDEAKSKIFKTIHRTLDTKVYYRSDIGDMTKDELKRLISNGWL
jgi:hypothetical protein